MYVHMYSENFSKTFIDKHFVPFAAQNEVALKIIFSFFPSHLESS